MIIAEIAEPYDLDGIRVNVGISVGIAAAPADGGDSDQLMGNADLALYAAKVSGGNRYCIFEIWMEAQARERRELEADLRDAIANNEFEIHYQTIVGLPNQNCRGAEALLRWRHPRRGLIYPADFVPIAEATGLIAPIGEWVLRRGCADAASWPSHLTISVNLSAVQIQRGDLLCVVNSALADSGLSAGRLKLEITETMLIESTTDVHSLLKEIKGLGVSIVLDDFGIGYCSMRYLQAFPIDEIKIDKSFIQGIEHDADSAAITTAIAHLARTLGIQTTAEGVETVDQLRFARNAGCQFAQGYLFSKPVPVTRLSFDHSVALSA